MISIYHLSIDIYKIYNFKSIHWITDQKINKLDDEMNEFHNNNLLIFSGNILHFLIIHVS